MQTGVQRRLSSGQNAQVADLILVQARKTNMKAAARTPRAGELACSL